MRGFSTPLTGDVVSAGEINGVGQTVTLECPGCASGAVHVNGTFNGVLEVVGTIPSNSGTEGGRLLFRAGVGSIGKNEIDTSGQSETINQEYRFIAGSGRAIVRATSWTSGSVEITITASPASNNVFIIGPVHTAEEEAVRAGRAYLASTTVLAVQAGNELYTTFENPAGSGRNVFLSRRLFGSNRTNNDAVLEYQAYAQPTMELANESFGRPRRIGQAAGTSIFGYEVAAAGGITIGGTAGSGGFIPKGGIVERRDVEVVLPPGTRLGFVVAGSGGNLANAARVIVTLEWYEEDIF